MIESEAGSFGTRLRQLRQAAGFTQEHLAERAGLSVNAVSQIERGGHRRPYPHTVRALAAALDLSDEEHAELTAALPKRGSADMPEAPSPPLPIPITPLVGRDDDVATVTALLPHSRLVTLIGPGGVGKTRLALAVATDLREDDADGVVFVPLASLSDPALVLPAIARAAGVREAARDAMYAALQTALRARRLLVLDNLEHLLAAVGDIALLLAACPTLTILATSREPLRIQGEQEYPVRPLAIPDLSRVPNAERVAGAASVQLFVRRAGEVAPTFALTDANAPAIAAICRRLDGLPLALELAAARIRLLPPTMLLARLDRALPLLTGGARDLPTRQQTMRDTIAWSHDLLSPAEQTLFRRLAVFVGGFTLEAAEAVCRGQESGVGEQGEGAPSSLTRNSADSRPLTPVLDLVAALLEKNLLVRSADMAGDGEEETEPRFGMLETIRAYALEQLAASGEEERIRGRHAAFYQALALEAGPELKRTDQVAWLDRLAGEQDNLRLALAWLLEHDQPERVIDLGWAIYIFWAHRGHSGEGRALMERALDGGDALSADARARALFIVALLSSFRGEVDRMALTTEACLAAARLAREPETRAVALLLRRSHIFTGGDLDVAAQDLAESLALFRELGDRWGIAHALISLAQLALVRDDDRAAALLTEAEVHSRAAGDQFTLALNLAVQAFSARRRGDDERVDLLLREAVGISAALGDSWTVVLGVTGLAGVAARRQQAERAARLFGAAAALRDSTGVDVAWETWRMLNERDLAAAKAALDEATFIAVFAAGRAMTFAETVVEALTDDDAPAVDPVTAECDRLGLTPRELEILQLLAGGHSNKEIGEALFISPRTVGVHVAHIYEKLDVTSRAAAVTFAHRSGLV